jgi:hypothetical protein
MNGKEILDLLKKTIPIEWEEVPTRRTLCCFNAKNFLPSGGAIFWSVDVEGDDVCRVIRIQVHTQEAVCRGEKDLVLTLKALDAAGIEFLKHRTSAVGDPDEDGQ